MISDGVGGLPRGIVPLQSQSNDSRRLGESVATISGLVITASRAGSSLYNYAGMLAKALDPAAVFVHLLAEPDVHPGNDIPNHLDLPGLEQGVPSLGPVFNNAFPARSFRNYNALVKAAAKEDAPVLYSSIDVPPLAPSSKAAVTFHDDPRAILSKSLYGRSLRYRTIQWLRMQQYRRFPYILATSRHVRSRLVEYGLNATVEVIHPCAAPEFVPMSRTIARSELRLPMEEKLILSVSSAEGRKNLPLLHDLLRRFDQDMLLVRVGAPIDGAMNMGRVPQADLVKLYNACNVLIHPSLEEGFGSPVAEALRVGLPVVASDIEVMEEITGNAALLVDARDPAAFLNGIKTILDSPNEFSKRSLARGTEFDFFRFQEEVRRFIRRLRGDESPARYDHKRSGQE